MFESKGGKIMDEIFIIIVIGIMFYGVNLMRQNHEVKVHLMKRVIENERRIGIMIKGFKRLEDLMGI